MAGLQGGVASWEPDDATGEVPRVATIYYDQALFQVSANKLRMAELLQVLLPRRKQ